MLIFLMFFTVGFTIPVVNSQENLPVVIFSDSGITGDRDFVVTDNGTYVAFQFDDDEDNYNVFASYDDGSTWIERTGWSNMTAISNRDFKCWIDDNDFIHCIIINKISNSIHYNRYKESADTWSNAEILDANGGYEIDEVEICANDDNDVLVMWVEDDAITTTTRYRIYWNDLMDWSGTQEWVDGTHTGLSSDVDTNGNFYILSYLSGDLVIERYNIGNDTITSRVVNESVSGFEFRSTDLAIKGSVIHCAFDHYYPSTTDSAIYYTYGSWNGGFQEVENIYYMSGEDSANPQISITSDDMVHILFDTDCIHTSNEAIIGFEGEYGDWSVHYHYSSGSNVNEICKMQYQCYPQFTWLTDGVIGIYENTTDNKLMFFSDGTQIQYNGTVDYDSIYDNCFENSILIEKMFDDSIAYRNTSNRFRVSLIGMGPTQPWYIDIWNDDEELPYYSFLPSANNPYIVDLFVEENYPIGNYSIRAKYSGDDDYRIECDFTIDEDNTNYSGSDWRAYWTQDIYYLGDIVDFYYRIPTGYNGTIVIYKDGDSDGIWDSQEYFNQNIEGNNILYKISDIIDVDVNIGARYWLQLYDSDTQLSKVNDYMSIQDIYINWDLFINEEDNFVSYVNAEDKVKFIVKLYGQTEGFSIKIYNNALLRPIDLKKSISIGNFEGQRSFNWYAVNYSVGMETLYIVLYGDVTGQKIDGINRILYVYDKEDINQDGNVDDEDSESIPISNTGFRLLLGIGIAFGVACLVGYYIGLYGFAVTGITFLLLFTRPEIAPYNYLPVEVGYAILGAIGILAFIIWKA